MFCKHCLYLLLVLITGHLFGQNNQILYDFNQLPQTLLLNPGAEVDYNKHFGVPFLSNIFVQVGATNTIGELTGDDPQFHKGDFFKLYQQIEVLNAGIRLKNTSYYLSFGMYAEQDGRGDVDQENEKQKYFKGDLSGIFHVGLSKRVNDKLVIGTRLKVVSGNLNIIEKTEQVDYIRFSNLNYFDYYKDIENTIPDYEDIKNNMSKFISSLFFLDGAGMGLGIDFGFTYKSSQNTIIAASILDLDFIPYSNNLTEYVFDSNSSGKIPSAINEIYHKAFRSPKFNASIKHQTTRQANEKYNSVYRNSSYVTPIQSQLITEFGLQTYMAFRPEQTVWAVTPFVSVDINRYLTTKLTYTYNEFSAKNIGLGISTHFKSFNFYVTADNLLDLLKWKDDEDESIDFPYWDDSNYKSVQLGMNFMFY